jgi:hypothetical protein
LQGAVADVVTNALPGVPFILQKQIERKEKNGEKRNRGVWIFQRMEGDIVWNFQALVFQASDRGCKYD